MHLQILYRFSPIKQVIRNDQRLLGLLPISYVFKNLYLAILLHYFSPVQFLEQFLTPSPFPHLSPLLPTLFHKPYPQSEALLNIRDVPSSAVMLCLKQLPVLCNFFIFFDVLPSASYYHWNNLNTSNVPHSFDLCVFNSWYPSIFSFSFLVTLICLGIAISIIALLLF